MVNLKMFSEVLNNKHLFKNVAATIEHAFTRGARSKYLVKEGTTVSGGVVQVFKKGDSTVVKHYIPSKGTIDTAFFSGNKTRLIDVDHYYEGITQPDKLVTQCWRNDSPFLEHSIEITKPQRQLNNVELSRGIHAPQTTTYINAYSYKGDLNCSINSYPTRIIGGSWSAGVERI